MDSALGETNVTSVDPHQIYQSGMPHLSVLYYCDDALHFWKAENCCGIHLCLQEPHALPAPPGWHCRDDRLHRLSWLGPAGQPLWAFLRFARLETSSISQFPTPHLHVLSSSWFLQVLHSDVWFSTWWWFDTSRCDDNIPVLLLLVMTNCQPLSLFLMVPGQLNSTAKAWKVCHNTGQIKETFRKAFLFLAFWKMVSFFLRPPSVEGLVGPTSGRPQVRSKYHMW